MNSARSAGRGDVLRRIANAVALPLGILASLATIAMMIAITVDVVVRNVSDRSVPGLLEMSESALVATVFLGLAYAGAANAHVAVDLLTDALPHAVARVLIGIGWVVSVVVAAWFTIATFERALESSASNEARQGLIHWPLWPARWIIVVGFAAFLIVAIINVLLIIRDEPLLGELDADADLVAANEARHATRGEQTPPPESGGPREDGRR